MKDYVTSYGKCNIGATYTTDDGKTRIKITIQDPKYSNIPIKFKQTVANGVEVDWGDGSATQTYSETDLAISHQYLPTSFPTTYTITFKVNSGTMELYYPITGKTGNGSQSYTSLVDEIHIGNNVTSIGNSAFYNCYQLVSITISKSVTGISNYAFYNCYSLKAIIIPNALIFINAYAFQNCHSLKAISIPNSVTSFGSEYVFQNCYSLTSVTIPNNIIMFGSYAFSNCYSLASVTIPDSVIGVGDYVFLNCQNLNSMIFPNSLTSTGSFVFYNCYSLSSINITGNMTRFNSSLFQSCQSLVQVNIPNSVTSIANSFFGCYSLASITIPASVTSIAANAFANCYSLATFDFRAHTSIPSLVNVNAFQNTPTTKEIIVPDDLYDDWIAASNWSSTTNNIVSCIVKASESSLGPLQ